MITKVRPRLLVHRGSVDALGYLFKIDDDSNRQVRARILSLWSSGAKVYRLSDGLVLRLPKKQPVRCERSLGMPLTPALGSGSETSQPLLATEFAQDELKSLNLSAQTVAYVRDGRAVVQELNQEEDPSSWLDVRAFSILPLQSFPSEPSTTPAAMIAPEKIDVRQKLNVPPASPEMSEVVRQMREGKSQAKSPLQSIFEWLSGQQRPGSGAPQTTSSNQTRSPFAPPSGHESPPEWMTGLKKSLLDLLGSMGLLEIFETKQAVYVLKMMDMFEQADWTNALKHAIPLGGEGEQAIRSLGVPLMRKSLDISLNNTGTTSSIHMPTDYLARLKDLYRAAFNSLSGAGRIDEAAFVLIELLQQPEEGVAFLERHGRFQLAAQLAEARNMRAPLVVRLWLLAGNTERAVAIARLRHAFAEAIALLEKSEPEHAYALRMQWVHYLAESGNYVTAAQIAQTDLKMNGLARAWVKRAIEAGDANSGQLLALIWRSFPGEFPELMAQTQTLLEDDSRENALARVAFVAELLKDATGDADCRAMMRQATRAILRDVGSGYTAFGKKQFGQLTHYSDDAVFWADMQAASAPSAPRSLHHYASPVNIVLKPGDSGTATVYDAVLLPSGRAFVALGEAGVYLVSPTGSVIKHFHAPADYFIESDHGDRVLCIAARGSVKRVTRIDALSGRADDLGEYKFDFTASSYDGSNWLAACDSMLMVMDGTSERCKLLWIMPQVPGRIESISRSTQNTSFIVRSKRLDAFGKPLAGSEVLPDKWEGWMCDEPGLFLRQRWPIANASSPGVRCIISPSGRVIEINTHVYEQPKRAAVHRISSQSLGAMQIDSDDAAVKSVISRNWLAIVTDTTCHLISLERFKVVAKVDLNGSTGIVPRLNDRHLVLCDGNGRLLAIDLQNGHIVRSLRIM